ncbi:MAG: hypothetical protein MZV65_48700 [Chromatiales bacterium]|nr:hypothetical protein [Chromatiales bacterium]
MIRAVEAHRQRRPDAGQARRAADRGQAARSRSIRPGCKRATQLLEKLQGPALALRGRPDRARPRRRWA